LIREHRPAGIEHETRHAGGKPRLELALENASVCDGLEAVALCPAAGIVLRAHVDDAGLEGFEQARRVAVEVDLDLVEIVATAIDRKILAPVVGISPEHEATSCVNPLDHIRATTDGRLEARALETLGRHVMLRQDRHEAQDQGDLAIATLLEGEAD